MLTASGEFVVDETVRRKTSLIEHCLPVSSVIDFGGMWEVNGYYSKLCKEKFGVKQVTMIDSFESRAWKRNPKLREGIEFRRGEFSSDDFMIKIRKHYDLALAYDVLLQQIDLRHTLGLMLSKRKNSF